MSDDSGHAAGPGSRGGSGSSDDSRHDDGQQDDGQQDGEQPGIRRQPGAQRLARAGFIEYDRVLFFSDAVFAIAITLLAVTLHVPARDGQRVSAELHRAVPGLIGFGISFAVIGLFWLGHHGIFRYIVALDRPLIALNLLFLGTIALLPYPTELLSVPSGAHATAVIFYAACAGTAGLIETVLWLYATHARASLTDPGTGALRLHYTLRIARIPVVFFASIPIAVIAPRAATYFWILVLISGIVINRIVPGR